MAESQFSDGQNVAAFLAADLQDFLYENIVATQLLHRELATKGSDSVKLRKKGSVTAGTGSENTAPSSQNYAQTTPGSLQIQEIVVFIEPTERMKLFSAVQMNELIEAARESVVQKVETTVTDLFDGFSTSVGVSGEDLTVERLSTATLTLKTNKVSGPYVHILHPKQKNDIQDEIVASASSIWANSMTSLDILGGQRAQINGFAGSLFGVDVLETVNTESINTNTDWSGFTGNPRAALAYMEDGRGLVVQVDKNITKRTEEIVANIYFDAGEREDAAGINIVSAQ